MKQRLTLTFLTLLAAVSGQMAGQVQLGQLSSNLAGTVSGGYTGDSGSGGSDHGFTVGGAATLSGFYYDPGFLNYQIQPFYNQSWANSDSQSLTGSSGVTAGTSLFSGSLYPGSISYSRIWDNTSNFNLPGLANFTTHGDSSSLNVGWSEHVENLPLISVNYQQGSGDYSLYGGNGEISNDYRGVSGLISYTILGFSLNGNYHFLENQSDIPGLLGEEAQSIHDRNSTYSFGIGHKLPFNGSFSGSASRSYIDSDYSAGSYKGKVDTVGANLSFNPTSYLTVGATGVYNDNLLASIYAPVLAAGGAAEGISPSQASHSLDITGFENYRIPKWHLTFVADQEHRVQDVFGLGYSANLFTGLLVYSNTLWGGYLTADGGATYTTVSLNGSSSTGSSSTGLIGSGNYSRNLNRWQLAVSGNYAQNAQTVLITYTTNSYGYSALLGRKFDKHRYWSVSAGGNRTGVVQEAGVGTFSQSYGTSFAMRNVTATASYTHSSGNGTLTASGITPVEVLVPVVTSTGVILFGGDAYTASVGVNPIRGLTVSGTYSHTIANTQADSTTTTDRVEQYSVMFSYSVRKLHIQGGYLHLTQGLGESGVTPVSFNSFYIGIMRWFNFF